MFCKGGELTPMRGAPARSLEGVPESGEAVEIAFSWGQEVANAGGGRIIGKGLELGESGNDTRRQLKSYVTILCKHPMLSWCEMKYGCYGDGLEAEISCEKIFWRVDR
jgi:hypothetical protein